MHCIFEDLVELSQKADKIIETAFTNQDFNEYFLYAKNTMREIMNGNFPKYDSFPQAKRKKKNEKKFWLRRSCDINFENESDVLVKNSPTSVTQNVESNDSGVVFVSPSDTEETLTLKCETNDKQFDKSNESYKSEKMDIRCHEADVNLSIFNSDKICLLEKADKRSICNKEIPIADETDIHKGNYSINITPENAKNLPNCDQILPKRRHTRSITKYCSKMGIPLDGSFHKPNDSLDKTNISDRTHVRNSTSSEENVVLNRTYLISSTSSEENNDCTIILSESSENSKVSDFSSNSKKNNQEKLEKNHDKSMKNNISNAGEKLAKDEILTVQSKKSDNTVKTKNVSDSFEKNLTNVTNFKPTNTFEMRVSTNKCDNIENSNDRMFDVTEQYCKQIATHFPKNYRNTNAAFLRQNLILKGFSKSATQKTNKGFTSPSSMNKHTFSCYNSSSDDTVPEIKKVTELKTNAKKLRQEQFLTNSAPVYRRQLRKRICRPSTPVEFSSDNNRQSLKDKVEVKRKDREIRVQKTKERRERLQKEKEEKNRLNEQRLKQRFEQHEKMLRQKVNKFKMQLQNRQQRNTRRCHSSTSTSSKDSKEDRAKDNDVCRNVLKSSQQLSKVDNSYHDMTLKKAALNSLQGNVGQNPEASKKQNSIVSCEGTPVDLSTNTDVTEFEKARIMPEYEKVTDVKNIVESEYIKADSCDTLVINSIENSELNLFEESNIIKSGAKQLKEKRDRLNKRDSEITLNEDFNLLLVQKLTEEDLNEPSSSSTIEKHKNNAQTSCQIITLSSENDNCGCSHFCFSSSKPKKNLKNNNKPLAKNKISMPKEKKQRCLTNPNKRIKGKKYLEKTPREELVTSYKISGMHEKSFDETTLDPSEIPLWATSLYLKQSLIQQYYKSVDVEKIFGTISTETIDLTDIFQIDKPEYHRRTSSEKWSLCDTP